MCFRSEGAGLAFWMRSSQLFRSSAGASIDSALPIAFLHLVQRVAARKSVDSLNLAMDLVDQAAGQA